MSRVHEARETLMLAEAYMSELGRGIDELNKIKLSDKKALEFMAEFFPIIGDMPEVQRKPYAVFNFEAVSKLSSEEAAQAKTFGQQFMEIVNATELVPDLAEAS